MKIVKGTHSILTVDDWCEYAPPKSKRHWADDRSAKELARAWCAAASNSSAPPEVLTMLSQHRDFPGAKLEVVEPECEVCFDSLSGEGCNADLIGRGTADNGPFAICVEGKADEPFGMYVRDELDAAARKLSLEIPTNQVTRVHELARALFHRRKGGVPKLGDIRYQLLTAVAGALAFAGEHQLQRAVLMIHEFRTKRTKDSLLADNQRDLDTFIQRLTNGGTTNVSLATLTDPIEVPGNKHIPAKIRLYIGKTRRDLLNAPSPGLGLTR